MNNITSNTTGADNAHYLEEYTSYLNDAAATQADIDKKYQEVSSCSLISALSDGLKHIVDHITEEPLPTTLADWREYINDPSNQNTHATISASRIIAAPDTWQNHAITFLFKMSQEEVAQNLYQTVAKNFQNKGIAQSAFNSSLQERAQTSHSSIFLQKALHAAIASAVPVINARLKEIVLTATPEQPADKPAEAPLATNTSTPNPSPTTTPPSRSGKYLLNFQENLQETIIQAIQKSLADSIVDTAVDRGVLRAIDQLSGMSVSMQLDPKATVELIPNDQNTMVNDVLRCLQQTLNAGIKAAIPVVNAWSKVKITLTLPPESNPAPHLPKEQIPSNERGNNAPQQPEASPAPPSPSLMQCAINFPQTLQETIVETLDQTLVGKITDDAVDRGITRALQQLSGVSITVQVDPNTKAPLGGVTHELVKEVIDNADVLIGRNLNRVTEAAKSLDMLTTLLGFARIDIDQTSVTDQAALALAMTNYTQQVGYQEQSISDDARQTIANDPLTNLFKKIHEETSALLNDSDIGSPTATLDPETTQAVQSAITRIAEASQLITQSILPSETEDHPSIDQLEGSLAPLHKPLKNAIAKIQTAALQATHPVNEPWEVIPEQEDSD